MYFARTSHNILLQTSPAACTASFVEPVAAGGNAPSLVFDCVESMSLNVSGLCGRSFGPPVNAITALGKRRMP
jgi:hypothetical protein